MDKKYDLMSENETIFRQLIKQKQLSDLLFCDELVDSEFFDEIYHEFSKLDLALCLTLFRSFITD